MRIVILVPFHFFKAQGGAEYQASLLSDWIAHNTEHELYYLARWTPDDCTPFPYKIVHFSAPKFFESTRWGLTPDGFSLFRELNRIRPDVIFTTIASAYAGLAAIYGKMKSVPLVWRAASDRDLSRNPFVEAQRPMNLLDKALFIYGIRSAAKVIVQTEYQANALLRVHGRRADAVIANFHHAPESLAPCPPGRKVIIWIANQKALKRPEIFVRLAEDFREEAGVEFHMIGKNQGGKAYADLFEEASKLPNFHYHGKQPIEFVNDLVARSYLLLNTSEYEGFPNTLIQAWIRGVPTLTLSVDPDGMMVRSGAGKLCGSYDVLKTALADLLADESKRNSMGAAAKDFADDNFSMVNARRYLDVMEQAFREARGEISS
ncbi:MAG: glycosyltransferase family 4 protein [Pseudomonadales bacterium]|nr:glycosyltransferase family 4 protein [Pseudomonadales bacterium]